MWMQRFFFSFFNHPDSIIVLLQRLRFSSGALFISKHNHQVTRGSRATWLHSFSKPGTDDLEIPCQHFFFFFFFFLVSLLRSLELLLGLCFIIVRIAQESSSPLPPVRLHSQTSRNETRFRPPDRGGTSSAALTCTGRKLRSRTLHFSEKSRGTLFSLSFFFWGGRFKTETGVVM